MLKCSGCEIFTKALCGFFHQNTPSKTGMDWEVLRRVPQMVRRKAKLGTNTCDEEFDGYYDDILRLDKRLETLAKYAKVVCSETKTTMKELETIGHSFCEFYDPLGGLPVGIRERLLNGTPSEELFGDERQRVQFEQEYHNWENSKIFIDGVKDIMPAIEMELDQLVELITRKAGDLQKMVKNIKSKCKLREISLYDYDSVNNEYDDLVIQLKSYILSAKDSSKMFRLERKTEEYKKAYEDHNRTLKAELPYFFKLVNMIFRPMLKVTYFVQLTVAYQIHNNLSTLADAFQINTSYMDIPQIVASFEAETRAAERSFNQLGIVNFTDKFLTVLTTEPEPDPDVPYRDVHSGHMVIPSSDSEYCEAVFSYRGILEGDLVFKVGDIIKVTKQEGNWWEGEYDGHTGPFPSNYVKLLNNHDK